MTVVKVSRQCPFCGRIINKTFNEQLLEDGIAKYRKGALLQDAFPNFSPDDREFLKTGICNDCWNSL